MPTYHYKDLSKILSEINTKKTVPIFLIAGDAFLTQEVTGKIIDQLLPAEIRSFNLEKVDGEKEDIYSLLERVQTFPFFPGPKIVLAINPVQLFSSGKPDRLWKKAEEAWQNGQVAHCVKLLRSLMQHAGISYSELLERGNPARAFMEKLFPERAGACPEWLSQVMTTLKDDQEDTLTPSSPDLILKSALEKGFPENHILIIQMEGDLGGKKVVNLIAQKGIVFNFSIKQAKKGEQTGTLKGYLSSRLSQERKSIHPKAEALLLERITPEIYQLEMELQKLLSHLGEGKQIQPEQVMALVTSNREEPLYELTTVLGEQQLPESLNNLRHLLDQGYNPLQIMAGIGNVLRRLLAAKKMLEFISGDIRELQDFGGFSARVLPRLKQIPLPDLLVKMHPFVLFNTIKLAARFSNEHLVGGLEALHRTDRLMKTSGGAPRVLLEDFIFFFCQTPPNKNPLRKGGGF